MSGLEVVGVVLAVIPLMLTALHDGTRVDIIDKVLLRSRYDKCKFDLEYQLCLFRMIINSKLLPLMLPDPEELEIWKNRRPTDQKDAKLEAKLKEQLSTSYDIILEQMTKAEKKLSELKKELRVGSPLTRRRRALLWIELLGSESFERAIEDQGKHIERFARLLEGVYADDTTLDQAMNREISVIDRAIGQLSLHASRIYDLIQDSWRCICKENHRANLRLGYQADPINSINICFINEHENSDTESDCWTWKEVIVQRTIRSTEHASKVEQPPEQSVHCSSQRTNPGCATSSTKLEPLKAMMSLPNWKDRWRKRQGPSTSAQMSNLGKSNTGTIVSLLRENILQAHQAECLSEAGDSKAEVDSISKIKNLCDTLKVHKDDTKCFGKLCFRHNNYYLYPPATIGSLKELNIKTLSSLFDSRPAHIAPGLYRTKTLRIDQAYRIALILAYAHAHLVGTSWISRPWSKDSIYFHPETDNAGDLSFGNPYISCNFDDRHLREKCNLQSLGVVLLELCFGESLDTYRQREWAAFGPELSRKDDPTLAVALLWKEKVQAMAGSDYQTAVDWCLSRPASAPNELRREIVRNLIQPLERSWRYAVDELELSD